MDFPSFSTPTIFDWFLLALMMVSIISGFRRGLVKVVLSLSGLITGVLLASYIQLRFLERIQAYLPVGMSAQILLFTVVVLAVYAGFFIVGAYVKESSAGAGMGLRDRLLAASVGALRGALMGAVVLAAFYVTAPGAPAITDSVLAPYILSGTRAVSFITPQTFQNQTDVRTDQPGSTSVDPLEARVQKQQ